VGGTQPVRTDLRLLAATNQDLQAAIRSRRFRKDLYYRLNVVSLTIPPLRERPEDIPVLASHFLARLARETQGPPMSLSPDAVAALLRHDWPGNVRELENVIERAVVLTAGPVIQAGDIAVEPSSVSDDDDPMELPYHASMEAHKRALIRHAIRKAGNKTKAALTLRLQPTYLSRLCRQLGIR
jgi:DNA-binding NtrC family response regulator